MVDNRSAGFFGIGGSFNFKSGDISGTAAKTADDRQSPGMDYFQQEMQEEGQQFAESQFVDRSAQLNATLNSLAMMNVANVINERKKALSQKENEEENSQRHKNQQQEQKDKRENAEKELEEEFYNIAKELKEDK